MDQLNYKISWQQEMSNLFVTTQAGVKILVHTPSIGQFWDSSNGIVDRGNLNQVGKFIPPKCLFHLLTELVSDYAMRVQRFLCSQHCMAYCLHHMPW